MAAYGFEAIQEGIEELNPNVHRITVCRQPRKFDSNGSFGHFEYGSKIKTENEDKITCSPPMLAQVGGDTKESCIESQLNDFHINSFDLEEGLSAYDITANDNSKFKINHGLHCCLMFVPVLNIGFLVIWILSCAGCVQWY